MLVLAIYLIGFAAMFVWQWRLPSGLPYHGKELSVAFAMGLWWPVMAPLIFIKYLASLAGYDI